MFHLIARPELITTAAAKKAAKAPKLDWPEIPVNCRCRFLKAVPGGDSIQVLFHPDGRFAILGDGCDTVTDPQLMKLANDILPGPEWTREYTR